MKFSEGHGWVQGQKTSAGPEENCSWNCGLCVFHLSEAKAAFSSVFCDAVTTPKSCVREGREKPSLKSQPKTCANIAELQLPLCRGEQALVLQGLRRKISLTHHFNCSAEILMSAVLYFLSLQWMSSSSAVNANIKTHKMRLLLFILLC